ncbi:MAG TPA: hypothetical protein DDY70_02600, partial [Clostridiales bacterium]|nr:hypothetical protein [Clostridiales bacterium]
SPAEQAGLSEGLSGALDRIEAERRRLSRRGGAGDIEDIEQNIAALTLESRGLREKADRAADTRRALAELDARLASPDGTAEYRAASAKERARALAALKAEEAELLVFFRAGIPTADEIRAAEHAYLEGKKETPSSAFAKKLRVPLFLLTLALGALGVAIGLSQSVFGYLLLLPTVFCIFRFVVGKCKKKGKKTLQYKSDALAFLSKYPCKTPDPFDEIRKKVYRIEEVRRAIGARENEDYERVTSPPSLDEMYRERATLVAELRSAEEAALRLEEKEGECMALGEKLKEDKKRLALLLKTRELLLRADEKLARTYLSRIADGLTKYDTLLGGKGGLSADSDLHLSGVQNGLSLPLEVMSRGERALSKLALRLSLADALGGAETPFLLLDDPFLAVDDEGVGRALAALPSLAKGRQILYFTCSASRLP